MFVEDIQKHIADMYALDISEGSITNITDKLIPELRAWQQRPLDAVYPFVWLDAIHYKIKDEGRYVNKAVYTVLGLNTEGHKELLGLSIRKRRCQLLAQRTHRFAEPWHPGHSDCLCGWT